MLLYVKMLRTLLDTQQSGPAALCVKSCSGSAFALGLLEAPRLGNLSGLLVVSPRDPRSEPARGSPVLPFLGLRGRVPGWASPTLYW